MGGGEGGSLNATDKKIDWALLNFIVIIKKLVGKYNNNWTHENWNSWVDNGKIGPLGLKRGYCKKEGGPT